MLANHLLVASATQLEIKSSVQKNNTEFMETTIYIVAEKQRKQ